MKTYRNVNAPAELRQLLLCMAIGGGLGFMASKLLKFDKTGMIITIIAGAVIGKLVIDKQISDRRNMVYTSVLTEHPECVNTDINLQNECLSRYMKY
jgi:uncharacterized membrane protein YeaQ/YmgE (transglycosylase-associated protein family)